MKLITRQLASATQSKAQLVETASAWVIVTLQPEKAEMKERYRITQ